MRAALPAPSMSAEDRSARVRFLVGKALVAVMATGFPGGVAGLAAQVDDAPPLPAGAIRLVSFVRHANRVAVCAEEPGPAVDAGVQSGSRTRVWVHDGTRFRQVATAPGTCDPAWSPDGSRIAVAAPDGVWVLSSDLRSTMHLVDTRHTETPTREELDHRTASRPLWSPDASRIGFVMSGAGTSWVEVVDAWTGETIYTSEPDTGEFTWGDDSASLRFGARVVRLP